MTDKQLQAKLNKAVKLLNEITTEIKRRYPDGYLFCECGEILHVMTGLDEGSAGERQEFVAMSSDGLIFGMDAGAW